MKHEYKEYRHIGSKLTHTIENKVSLSDRKEYDGLSVGAVGFEVYDDVTGHMNEVLVDWTRALEYIRLHHGGRVTRVLWMKKGDRRSIGRHGWTYAKWTEWNGLYQIEGLSGGAMLREVSLKAAEAA